MIESLTCVAAFEVREVCAALETSPSGFYAHRHQGPRMRRHQDQVLSQAMHQAFTQSGAAYGSPRLVRALRRQGLNTSKIRPEGTRCGV